jgi:hypothetical protein
MKIKNKKGDNLKYAVYFIVLLLFFVAISFLFKLLIVLKNSTFDGIHSYNLEFKNERSSCVVAFSPATKKIAIVDIEGRIKESVNKNLSVPVDATILSECPTSGLFSGVLGVLPKTINVNSKPSALDVLKLAFLSRGVSGEGITRASIDPDETDLLKQEVLEPLFSDQTIIDEKKTVQIINSTETPGLGLRMANLLTNIGANIVLVVTSEKKENDSKIYYTDESYSVDRISSVFGIEKIKKEGRQIADIIIVIGDDHADTLKF